MNNTNKKILSFIGLPASGKGTQVEILVKNNNAKVIGIGNLVRSYIKNNTEDKDYNTVLSLYNDGKPAPDEFVFRLIKEYLEDVKEDIIVFDNFPFTEKQSELFDAYVAEKKYEQPKIIYININPEIVINRMTLRLICPECGRTFIKTETQICPDCNVALIQRADDTEETVRKRIESYMPNINKMVEIYSEKNMLIEINGDQSIEAVSKEIEEKIQ